MGLAKEPKKPTILFPVYIALFDLAMYITQFHNYSICAQLYRYWETECGVQFTLDECSAYPQCSLWAMGLYQSKCESNHECKCVASGKLYYPPIIFIACLIFTIIYDCFDSVIPAFSLCKLNVDTNIDQDKEEKDIDAIKTAITNAFSEYKIQTLSNSFTFIALLLFNNVLWRFCVAEYYNKGLFFKYRRHHVIYCSMRYIPYIIITIISYFTFRDLKEGVIIYWYNVFVMTALLFVNEILKLIYKLQKPYEKQEHVSFILDDYFGPYIADIIWQFVFPKGDNQDKDVADTHHNEQYSRVNNTN